MCLTFLQQLSEENNGAQLETIRGLIVESVKEAAAADIAAAKNGAGKGEGRDDMIERAIDAARDDAHGCVVCGLTLHALCHAFRLFLGNVFGVDAQACGAKGEKSGYAQGPSIGSKTVVFGACDKHVHPLQSSQVASASHDPSCRHEPWPQSNGPADPVWTRRNHCCHCCHPDSCR